MSPGAEPRDLPIARTAASLLAVDTPDAASVGARSASVGTISVRLSEAALPGTIVGAATVGGGAKGRDETAAMAPATAIAMPIPGAIQRRVVAEGRDAASAGAGLGGVTNAGVGFGVTQDRGSNDGS